MSPTFKEQQSAPETLQAFAEQILREEFRNFTISAPDVQSGPGQSSPSHKRTYYETNLAEGVKVTVEFGETPDGTFAGGFVLVDTQGAESGELADVLAIFERYFIVEDVQSRDWQPISFPNSPADGWEVATIRTDGSLHTWSSYSYCGTPGQGCQIGVAICVLYEGSETYDAKSCFLPE